MRVLRRITVTVVVLIGVAAVIVGGAGVWADRQFEGRRTEATVILSGQRLLDVQFAVDGRRIRTTVWRTEERALIGDRVNVEVADSRPRFARLAEDDRFGRYGRWLVVGGAVLIAGTWAAARVRRRPGRTPASPVGQQAVL